MFLMWHLILYVTHEIFIYLFMCWETMVPLVPFKNQKLWSLLLASMISASFKGGCNPNSKFGDLDISWVMWEIHMKWISAIKILMWAPFIKKHASGFWILIDRSPVWNSHMYEIQIWPEILYLQYKKSRVKYPLCF